MILEKYLHKKEKLSNKLFQPKLSKNFSKTLVGPGAILSLRERDPLREQGRISFLTSRMRTKR